MALSSLWNFAVFLAPRTEGAVEGTGTVAVSAMVVTETVAGAGVPGIAAGPHPFEIVGATGEMILLTAGVIILLTAHLLDQNP